MARKELKQQAKKLAKDYGYLPYMIERYLSLWGEEETVSFLDACENPVRTSVRFNLLKASLQDADVLTFERPDDICRFQRDQQDALVRWLETVDVR